MSLVTVVTSVSWYTAVPAVSMSVSAGIAEFALAFPVKVMAINKRMRTTCKARRRVLAWFNAASGRVPAYMAAIFVLWSYLFWSAARLDCWRFRCWIRILFWSAARLDFLMPCVPLVSFIPFLPGRLVDPPYLQVFSRDGMKPVPLGFHFRGFP